MSHNGTRIKHIFFNKNADFYIPRLSNYMKVAGQKNNLGRQILYRSLERKNAIIIVFGLFYFHKKIKLLYIFRYILRYILQFCGVQIVRKFSTCSEHDKIRGIHIQPFYLVFGNKINEIGSSS